jgi:spermidine synthase
MIRRRIHEVPEPDLIVGLGPRAAPVLWSYVGNLEAARSLVGSGPLNTDDRPLIEYLAPVTHRRVGGKTAKFLIKDQLIELCADFLRAVPPEKDPYLSRLTWAERGFPVAGYYTIESAVARRMNEPALADSADARLRNLLMDLFRQPVSEE